MLPWGFGGAGFAGGIVSSPEIGLTLLGEYKPNECLVSTPLQSFLFLASYICYSNIPLLRDSSRDPDAFRCIEFHHRYD